MKHRIALWIMLAALPLTLSAQPIEIKLRITPVDTPTRKSDTNFQMAATSGFSVVQTLGNYYLFTYSEIRKAWKTPDYIDMHDLIYPGGAGVPNPCDQHNDPRTFDHRCGDNNWVVWKPTSSTSSPWSFFNVTTGQTASVAAVPAANVWPYDWDTTRPERTGVPGQQNILDGQKVNQAITDPLKQTSTRSIPCTRETFNPGYYATGTVGSKAVYVNGKWYMAFNINVDNPSTTARWTAEDMFRLGWATSTDGKSWTVRHLLFRSSRETVDCGGGLVIDQLFTDNGYFYLLADEQYGGGLILLRAPINTSITDGYGAWQVATKDPWLIKETHE